MDTKQKYVRLKEYDEIIIFPCVIEHSRFKHMNPISAGFCYVHADKIFCFGASYSLNLEANEKEDSFKATYQIFGFEMAEKLL